MRKRIKKHISKIAVKLVIPYAKKVLKDEMNNLVFTHDNIDFNRKDAFVILGNHLYEYDALAYGLIWKRLPISLVSRSLMVSPMQRFKLRFLADSISKSQGENDIKAVKQMIQAIRQGNSLLILPEGEVSYFGATQHIDMSISKLLKKLNVDVITAVSKGGHMSRPRWALSKRVNRYSEVHFSTLISKEEMKTLSTDDIYLKICSALEHNDFDWQRENMVFVGGDARAEGLEKFLYKCTECGAFHSIITEANDIICTNCNNKGYIDEYGFIKGFKFDNTVEWNNFQLEYVSDLKKTTFSTEATHYHVDYDKLSSKIVGEVTMKYEDKILYVDGVEKEIFEVENMEYVNVTQRNVLTFDYNNKHYYYKLKDHFEAIKQVCT
ncbi:hypothetical protein RJG79_02775 [Mycoplasmatota bacterium WC44]